MIGWLILAVYLAGVIYTGRRAALYFHDDLVGMSALNPVSA